MIFNPNWVIKLRKSSCIPQKKKIVMQDQYKSTPKLLLIILITVPNS